MRCVAIPGLDLPCAQLVMGTSSFRPATRDAAFELLDAYVERGGNALDTSRVYGVGAAERTVAMWLQARGCRDRLILVSKGGHHEVDAEGVHHPERQRVRPECITEDLGHSLAALGTDRFELFLLHRDDPSVPVGELVDALEAHRRAREIVAYGVSNWTPARMDEFRRHAKAKGYPGLAANSASLSLAHVNEHRWVGTVYAGDEDVRWHERTQVPLLSWAAQASGFFHFAPRYERGQWPVPDVERVYCSPDNLRRLARASELASARGAGYEAAHVALAWVLSQGFPTCAVVGPQRREELLSNLCALELELTAQERRWLDLRA